MDRQYYLWTAGGSPVSVALSPTFIKRFRQAAAVSPNESNDSEIGGILLGLRQSPDEVTVEDFELLTSEHRRGATFTLSQSDRKKLEQRLRAKHHGLEPVGSFRTHIRQGLYMDQYDFDLMSSHFAGPEDVMLLIRPADWQAGIFVWEDGDIRRQKSYAEFPFDSSTLPLTAIAIGGSGAAAPRPKTALMPVPRKKSDVWSRLVFPTVAKVALMAATFGAVAVLAHFAAGHHSPAPSIAATTTPVTYAESQPAPPSAHVNPPIDPDLTSHDLSEMHVRVPSPDRRPSPFGQPLQTSQPDLPPAAIAVPPAKTAIDLNATPAPLPPIQSAANLPPGVAPLMLKPTPPTLVSVVSLQPTEPGVVSRSINRIPVLNLLQRHKYKAGENFAPAKPVRQVRPKLPADLRLADTSPAVDVKVWIDKSGQVTKAELLTDNAQPEVGDIAANAALKWTFEPARVSDRPVSSEMVMHFHFAAHQATESYSALRRPTQHP